MSISKLSWEAQLDLNIVNASVQEALKTKKLFRYQFKDSDSFVNILEDTKAQEKVISLNNGRATVPTIIINNSQKKIILSEPTDAELAKAISKLSLD